MRLVRWLIAGALLTILALALQQLPALGAGGLLHPSHRRVTVPPPEGCEAATFPGYGVTLKGWRCGAGEGGATIIYLHGIADNRTSSEGVIRRFLHRGFNVIAYDSRAHGESGGAACTYGFFEREDLRRVADTVTSGPIALIGTSLGAAVALQEAGSDPRVAVVVAAEAFSDLRTVATERAPFVFTKSLIDRAFRLAEQQGHFDVDAVSPVSAAAGIRVPVLLIHGAEDVDTPPAHSQRILNALAGPKRLILVPGAHHNESLNGPVWTDIEQWVERGVRAARNAHLRSRIPGARLPASGSADVRSASHAPSRPFLIASRLTGSGAGSSTRTGSGSSFGSVDGRIGTAGSEIFRTESDHAISIPPGAAGLSRPHPTTTTGCAGRGEYCCGCASSGCPLDITQIQSRHAAMTVRTAFV